MEQEMKYSSDAFFFINSTISELDELLSSESLRIAQRGKRDTVSSFDVVEAYQTLIDRLKWMFESERNIVPPDDVSD